MANKNTILLKLGDESVPLEHRSSQLVDILAGAQQGNPVYAKVASEVFQRLSNACVDEKAQALKKSLEELLEQLKCAPMKPATFIQMDNLDGSSMKHALVSSGNGELAWVCAHDQQTIAQLNLGDDIMLDGTGKIIISPVVNGLHSGPEAIFERVIDDRHIECRNQQDERIVVLAGPQLIADIRSEKVKHGAYVVLGAGARLAIMALPPVEDALHYFRFLDRGGVPDVIVERDIGNPSKVIAQVAKHVREEMTRPELRRKYRLRPCKTLLFSGVSGCGKTLHIQAIHRLTYDIMAEVTGAKLDELPHRVFRVKAGKLLSMWFGESDKNIDRIFDEVEQLADRPWEYKGKKYHLPVLVILEEADGMGRSRGSEGNDVYDRVMTTMLQRLDPNRQGLADRLVVFLSTTNEPHMVDPAFLRRIGGSVETFGRLDQKGFNEILSKHVCGLPADNWKTIVSEIDDWLYGPKDQPVVELSYAGYQGADAKHRRHFMTGAIINRAVESAAERAWEMAIGGDKDAPVTAIQLAHAFKRQVDGVIHQLTPQNADRYLDLPEGIKVTGVKRVQPQKKAEATK